MDDDTIKMNHDVNWKVLAESNLLSARAMLSMAHSSARMHIKEAGAIELRDMAEDTIYEIDMYGQKHIENWQPQDLGAI